MPIAAGDERHRPGDETPYGVVGEYTNASATQLLGHGFKKMHCGESREVGEVALALMLAARAGLMIRSFNKLQELDLGLAPSGVLSAQVPLPAAARRRGTASRFSGATVGYFRTMRIPFIAGRAFTEFDGAGTTPVVIINDTLARLTFAGENPIGRRLFIYGRPRQIVGVVGSVRHHGFTRDPRPEMVLPYRQFQFTGMTVVARSEIAQSAVEDAIRGAVQALDPVSARGRSPCA